jgi:hypothetical protein
MAVGVVYRTHLEKYFVDLKVKKNLMASVMIGFDHLKKEEHLMTDIGNYY